jgi:hypothetical protein
MVWEIYGWHYGMGGVGREGGKGVTRKLGLGGKKGGREEEDWTSSFSMALLSIIEMDICI